MAEKFGIASLDEARDYLAHGVLGPRLRECTGLIIAQPKRDIVSILGRPDDLKFRSSMTLFAAAAPGEAVFQTALDRFFAGAPDSLTLDRLTKR